MYHGEVSNSGIITSITNNSLYILELHISHSVMFLNF